MNSKLTLGSLFDGSGGFPLGGLISGITPVWSSEIEPFCIRVTSKRLPQVKHYGNVSYINGNEIEPVDIITFGSPCQDMSVAGKRSGLDGERSSLFYEAIRIIKEMRCATNGKYPRYIVWENVPGAFSSNKGEDFKAVLESICKIKSETFDVSMPKKWQNAGNIVADDFSIAWRVLDAQYWGVPQRRKRIYLVADFAGECAGKILFESEGLSGYSEQSFNSWQGAATNIEKGIGATGISIDGYNSAVSEKASTLGVNCGMSTGRNGVLVLNDQGGNRMDVTENKICTLRAESHHPPLVFENHGQDTRYTQLDGVAPTVISTYGTGGNNQPFVVELPKCFGICSKDSNSMKSANPKSGFYEANTTKTIDSSGGNPSCNQGGMAVVALQGSMIGRADKNGPQGSGVNEGVSFTLNTTDKHAAVYALDRETFNCGQNYARNLGIRENGINPTLNAQGPSAVATPESSYIVRRLTPTECARLQGFPDWWCADLGTEEPTDEEVQQWKEIFNSYNKAIGKSVKPKTDKQIIKWLKNPHSDSAEYRMWGNGVSLPCVCFVLSGIVYYSQLTT